jgi:undecaprenyl-diphosphatase
MTILQAIILGIVQGLTEYVPVSSSAHLILVPWLFGWNNAAITSLPFDVALHMGTLLAVLAYFAGDWVRLIRAGVVSIIERRVGNDPDRRLAWLIIIGCIPGGIAGLLGESAIEHWFHQPNVPIRPAALLLMAGIIALLGLLLYLADRASGHERPLASLSLKDAIVVGLAQALAVFPGVSRSGSTITAGLGLGLKREAAARYSFLLSAPIVAGAGAKSLLDLLGTNLPAADFAIFLAGFLAAAVSGYLTIRALLGYLQKHSAALFVYYRWALAVLIVVVVLARG